MWRRRKTMVAIKIITTAIHIVTTTCSRFLPACICLHDGIALAPRPLCQPISCHTFIIFSGNERHACQCRPAQQHPIIWKSDWNNVRAVMKGRYFSWVCNTILQMSFADSTTACPLTYYYDSCLVTGAWRDITWRRWWRNEQLYNFYSSSIYLVKWYQQVI